jgi:amino acid adenylation domain-containing protein/non-ribosomal peptide synthase protein (TIGR01720 family)
VGPDSLVALGMRRSIDLVVGMYAVTVAGGAYVPLDPDHPAERNQYVLDIARPVGVLTTVCDEFDAGTDVSVIEIDRLDTSIYSAKPVTDADRIVPLRGSNTAYVIFTSGSTGRPKGVAVSHAAIVNRLVWMQDEYDLYADDVVLQKTPATFDVSVWEFFWPLQVGARLVVAKPDGHRDPAYLADLIVREGVTTTHFVPSMLSVFVAALDAAALASRPVAPAGDRAADCTSLINVFASGEALPAQTAQRLIELTGARLHNLYGPTEAAVDVTFHEVTEADKLSVPIGRPVFNTRVYVLDSRLHPVAPGVAGELYLVGVQLARGYVERPELTADRFVANPFIPGERMYRTGDLVRWTASGELEYLGRTDFQVKLRGLRIELGEIEAALTALDSIARAVVVVHSDDRLGDQLVGYVVAAAGRVVDLDGVRVELAEVLPAYMVPSAWVVLDAFPLNASGKLDRKALPAPVFEAKVFRAPSTPIEEIVAGTFEDVLGVPRVGVDDDFFDLGGNSLIATQVTARLGAALDTQLAVRDLFEASTVAALAARVELGAGSGRSRPRLVAGVRPERIPLSPAQQRYWFLNQFDTTTSAVDNIPLAVRLSGTLDVAALEQAIGDVFARHEVLRTTYPRSSDGPHQVILPAAETAPVLAPVEVTEAELVGKVIEFALTTFDVTAEIPLQVALFRVVRGEAPASPREAPGDAEKGSAQLDALLNSGSFTSADSSAEDRGHAGAEPPQEHVLAMTVHHVSADGSSMGPLARDVMAAYAARVQGEAPQWQPLPVQYADYALWQRAVLGSEDDPESLAARQVGYWRATLDGLPDQLELPTDRLRPPAQSFQGKAIRFDIDPLRHARLHEMARADNASLFMVVHAALAVLLARLSGTGDIAVGTPIAGRGERELDDLIGMFVNTLVFRTRIDSGATFAELLADVRERDLEAFANADVPFERLVEVLNPVRSTARNPLFQVGLSFQNLAETAFELPGLSVSSVNFDSQLAKTDLHVTLYDRYHDDGTPAEIVTEFGYAIDLFDEATVQGFADRFVRVLDAVIADTAVPVGDIDLLDPAEKTRILQAWNDTAHALPRRPGVGRDATLASLLDAAVAAGPDAVAIVADESGSGTAQEVLTYAELDARVNRLARYLLARGIGAEDRVALAIRRSVDLVVAMYAVARSGAAYVPIDPGQPAERIDYILATAGPACVLTTVVDGFDTAAADAVRIDELDLAGYGDGPIAPAELVRGFGPESTAYVIFTSGSTGQPKGVAVPHGAIVNQLLWKTAEFGLDATDAVLLKTAATFDLSVWEFWTAAVCGGRLVIAAPEGHRDPAYLNELMLSTAVTTLHVVPSMLDALLTESDGVLSVSLRRVLAIGEALPAATAQRFRRENPGGPGTGSGTAVLFNLYGPTEAAVSITSHRVTDADQVSVSIGAPEWNSQVYVLDARLRPVPVGVSGELYLAGAQLARGYFGRPDLTADRFVANPFGMPGTRLYRTGDLVAWTAAGELEYRGRTDFQVKIRGFRIELGEIEAALLRQDAIAAAAVLAHSDPHIGARLVAYIVGSEPGELNKQGLSSALAAELPSYMVPSVFMQLDALPLNANGKLDRKALPEPSFEKAVFRAPVTPIEQIVAGTFADVLRVESGSLGLDDDFFTWGGNSLLATQVAARLGEALNTRVPVRLLFEASTVAALAVRVEQHAGAGGRKALIAGPRPQRIPLSLAQQRMWFLNRFDTASAAYNVPIAVRLTGELNLAALRAAIADLVARHEILRTVYPLTGVGSKDLDAAGPVQVILPTAQAVPDLEVRTVAPADIEAAVVALTNTIFDVTTEVPVKVALFEITDTEPAERPHVTGAEPAERPGNTAPGSVEYVLAMVVHHISGDGSSMGPLTRDLMTAYAARSLGEAPAWAPLAVQYADYSIWQRELLGDEDDPESLAAKQVAYWQRALAGLPDQLDLPSDRPRPPVQSFAGGKVELRIDAETHRALLELARTEGATLFMVVHTALAVLLARLSGTDDVTIGTPMAGRGEAVLDDLIGMFVNTLVFRTQVPAGEPFTDLLARQRETDIAAFANADVPFERLVEVLNPVRSTARHPLFQVGLSFQNLAQASLELPGLRVSGLDFDTQISQFDLHLIATDRYGDAGEPEGITGFFTYAADMFERVTVQGFVDRFVRLLGAIVAAPRTAVGDIDLLDAAEQIELLVARNATARELPGSPGTGRDATLASLLAAPPVPSPTAVALIGPDGAVITYAELSRRVNRLARHLISLGVRPESRVALALRRSVDLVVAMYAVTAAGGAYVPVDPDQPAERVGYILETADPVCVLTGAEHGLRLSPERQVIVIDELDLSSLSDAPVTDADRILPLRGENTAYVIFTSGSTGRPKGVAVSHAAVVNQLRWKTAEFELGIDDVVLLKTAATFDLSVWEFWSAVVSGGRLVIATADGHRDPAYLNELMAREGVTTLHVVPSMLDALLTESGGALTGSLRWVLAIGEALPAATAQRFRRDNAAGLFNLYGPTEAAVSVTGHRVTGADQVSVPIGAPEWNNQVYVLDSRLHPVPDGVAGELYLAGAQLARGYFGRPDLTADRFVANLFEPGARMYRTGDLVAWNKAGELEYRGRTDFQVKIRGFRIELGEIEAALLAVPEVAQTAVLAKQDEHTGDRLVAYLVPSAGEVDVAQVKSALAAALPSYMVPSAFVVLDALPLTVNGKLDRKALPEPEFETIAFRAPSTPIEEVVASVFAGVLGVERVGADDDFFALGGNSLLATQIAARLGAVLDTRVPVRVVFEASTVAGLAAKVEQQAGAGGRPPLQAGPRPDRIPLSLAQHRMWFLNQFDTSSAVENIPVAIRLSGDLDVAALQHAVTDLVARHEVLRTIYPETPEGPVQQVLSPGQVPVDLQPVPIGPDRVRAEVAQLVSAGFDVTTEIPFHIRLFEITAENGTATEFVLVLVAHHVAADGWSMGPLTRDLMVAYVARSGGAAPAWAPLVVQYADYSIWQRTLLGSEDDPQSLISTQADYWRRALAGVPDELNLPFDRPRPAVQSFAGGSVVFLIGIELHQGLQRIAREQNATLFMVMHTALAVFLARMSGTDDIAIGTPIAGRGEAELDDLIGMFVNTLVLRTHVRGQLTFAELLSHAKDADLQAFAHADIPFERLVELLNPERSTARHPLFQVALSFENLPESTFELPGLHVAAVDFDVDTAKFDLSLTIRESVDEDTGMYAEFSFARDLFDDTTIEGFAQRFTRLLEAVVAERDTPVGDLPLLAPQEYRLLTRVHGEDVMATGLLPDLMTHGVRLGRDRIAVRYNGRSITYGEIDQRSSRLARVLIERGVGPEKLVAVSFPRSYEMVLAVMAIAKAGGAHVPVDPTYPEDRVRHMLTDSGAVLGITGSAHVDGLPDDVAWLVLDDPVTDELCAARSAEPVTDADRLAPLRMAHPAYVIYTSGSTGKPKGVTVTHAGLGGLADVATGLYGLEPQHRFLHICSPSFDPSVLEWVCAFYIGATLVIVPSHIIGGPDLAELLRTEQVTHTIITPAVLGTMDPAGQEQLLVTSVGGDVTTPELVAKWQPGRKYFNAYGPTETTIISSYARLFPGNHITIGTPVHGMSALVLDSRLNPVPPGVAGELYLAGGAVARGYRKRPGLTSERFIANPWGAPGTRMYRTGDVVRWYAPPAERAGNLALPSVDWELDYVGRSDFQVKIRGFRIELGEIDAVLGKHPDVEYVITLGRETAAGATILVSYVLGVPGRTVDPATLTEYVARTLPPHMVPSAIVVIDEIPLTPVGKLDRRALPEPELAPREFRAPASELETIIAEVFAEVLGVGSGSTGGIGLDDSFFALGGDSILSIQLVSRAKARGVLFTPRDVFERRSVAALAEIATLGGDAEQQRLPELPGGGVGEIPLTPIMASILDSGSSYQRFSQSMALRVPDGTDRQMLVATLGAVFDHHDVLRGRLRGTSAPAGAADYATTAGPAASASGTAWTFEVLEQGAVDVAALVHRVELPGDIDDAELSRVASAEYDAALGRLDPANAAMVQFVWFAFTPAGATGPEAAPRRRDVLLVVAHHFVVDGVSWRILIPDLALAWSQLAAGQPVALPANGTSMRRWAHALVDAAKTPDRVAELPFWQQVSATADPLLGAREFDPAVDTIATVERVEVTLPAEVTDAVLTAIPGRYRGGVNDGLLSALALAVSRWRGETAGGTTLVKLEGHGREEDVVAGADLSRTVGWFTSGYPVRLDLAGADLDAAFAGEQALGDIVKSVKEQLLAVPDKGLGYGLLRYLNPHTAGQLAAAGQISFNYLGRVSTGVGASDTGEIATQWGELGWVPVADLGRLDADMDPDMPANGTIDINAIVTDGPVGPELGASFAYPAGLLSRARVQEFADLWVAALTALARHAQRPDAGGLTPSDLPLVAVGQADIEGWERAYPALADVWPLSPLQSGLLFHALMTQSTVDVYTMQAVVDLGGVLDVPRLRAAAQGILDRYPNLRTAFVTDSDGQAVQVVLDRVETPWREVDLTGLPESQRLLELQRLVAVDRETHFDMTAAPLLRFTLYRTAVPDAASAGPSVVTHAPAVPDAASGGRWHLAITTHHILLDGWSMPLLMRDLLVLYAVRGDQTALPRVTSYRTFLGWLAARDRAESLRVWAKALSGVDEPTALAPQPRAAERYEIAKLVTEIDADRTRRITKQAAELGVTVNTLVQAAWGILLGRLTGRGDVVFGATVSGRPAELPGVESMVGLFINTLPVRVRIDDRLTVSRLLQRLQRDQADLLDHHYVGLTDIQRIAGAGAQFDTLLVFESYPMDKEAIAAASSIDGMSVTGVGVNDATHYPLTLLVMAESTLELTWKYLASRFTADEVDTLAARMIRVLEALLGDPDALVGDIDILDHAERARILTESGITATESVPEPARVGARTVAKTLGAVVEEDPQAPALLADGTEIAYHAVDSRSSQLARVLISRGVGPGDVVAVALPRSVDAVVALWAVQKAGAAALFADGLSFGEIVSAGAGFGITQEPAATSVRWLVPSDPKVRAELAAAPAHPVSYADRVRPLHNDHPAFVIRAADGSWLTLTQEQALDHAGTLRAEHGIDYESTTYTTASAGPVALAEFLASATAGALSVLVTGDIEADLADGEVTHWFVVPGEPTDAAEDEVQVIVAG